MAIRNINRNVRGQIISYPITEEGVEYGNIYFVDVDGNDGDKSKGDRYSQLDISSNFDIEIKELSFPIRSVVPNQVVRQRARIGAEIGSIYLNGPANTIPSNINSGVWPPFIRGEDGVLIPNGYGFPPDTWPYQQGGSAGPGSGAANDGASGQGGQGSTSSGGQSSGDYDSNGASGGGFLDPPYGLLGTGTIPMGTGGYGNKIICNELYRQGYLSEELWNADERYGDMMFDKDPRLVIGYQMWARKVVKFMKENPNNTKLAYWLFKPWTEYMGYKMGVVEKPTLRGRFTNWIGSQFSYMVFNLYNGKRLLDKYNYKVFRQENNIPNYKMA